MIKKIISILSVLALSTCVFTACGKSNNTAKLEDVEILNYTAPVEGEKIAVITFKDFGKVKIKLFPEEAPKGVENFTTHAENGYYDELIMHRVVKDFCIQGGDPKGNGTGGKSIWGQDFDIEASDSLRNLTGAVAYAHAQDGGNGSQFYIITAPENALTDDTFTSYAQSGYLFPENVKAMYKEKGGVPSLDGDYTVFGQVFEGMDVVMAINNVEVRNDGTSNAEKPIDQVLIEKIEIQEYKG